MKLEKIELPEQNKVLQAYYTNDAFLHKYFDYPNEKLSYKERVKELKERCFKRQELADVIYTYMAPFGLSDTASKHIEELKKEEAVMVVGGQQAGILTGPLYSVHKAITVILLAKQQRESLGVPVIPVFWVAGEDHDLNEINHVYSETNGSIVKEQMKDKFVLKLMASDAQFDREEMKAFVERIFENFGETRYTDELLAEILEAIHQENTFTRFFVRLMNGLFADEGLLFIDAAYEPLRKLESTYFQKLIQESERIATAVAEKERQLEFDGFGTPIDAQMDATHLFYVHETGRMLLNRKNNQFVNESAGLQFTTEELLQIANENPALLSNNVATRPLMQEFLLPVLSFVGGAGELAYWAILKDAFHHLGLKMPIFVPRLSMTLVSRKTEKVLKEQNLTVEEVMRGKATNQKMSLFEKLHDTRFVEAVNQAEANLLSEYEKLNEWFNEDDAMMKALLKQNIGYHTTQFTYLKNKYEDSLYLKHEVALRKFDQLDSEIYPEGQLQERIYHPYFFLNQYGPTLIKDLLALPFESAKTHYAIYL